MSWSQEKMRPVSWACMETQPSTWCTPHHSQVLAKHHANDLWYRCYCAGRDAIALLCAQILIFPHRPDHVPFACPYLFLIIRIRGLPCLPVVSQKSGGFGLANQYAELTPLQALGTRACSQPLADLLTPPLSPSCCTSLSTLSRKAAV